MQSLIGTGSVDATDTIGSGFKMPEEEKGPQVHSLDVTADEKRAATSMKTEQV